MSRFAGYVFKMVVLGSLGLVWAWPLLATILEASQAVATFQASLTGRGWPRLADRLDDWPGSRSVILARGVEPGALLAPASASPRSDQGMVSRPIRLGMETLGLVLLTELLALPVGIALAWFLFRSDIPGASVLLGILALAAFVPLPLLATAWLGAFGNVGRLQALGSRPILVGRLGAAVVHALAALPWVVLLVGVGLRSVEAELEDSADLDRPPWWVAIHVTLRRGLGGIAAAALAVAVLTAGDMTVTDLLQIRTYAEEAYLQSILGEGPENAAAVAIPPMLVLGPSIGFMAWSLTRAEPRRLASVYSGPPRRGLNAWRIPVGMGLFLVVGLFAGLPIYGLFWRAGRVGGRAMLGQPPQWSLTGLAGTMREALDDSWEPLETSLVWSAMAALFATVLAWSVAWLCRSSWFWRLTALLTVATCLAAPGPVAGMALKIAYRTLGPISDSAAILVLGLVCRTLPYAILILWPATRMIPPELLDIAAISGYGPWSQLYRIAVPFTRPTIWLACTVCFALAIGELPATNLVLPPGVTTISMRVWTLLHTGVESHLAGVTLVMLAAVTGAGLLVLAAARASRAHSSKPLVPAR